MHRGQAPGQWWGTWGNMQAAYKMGSRDFGTDDCRQTGDARKPSRYLGVSENEEEVLIVMTSTSCTKAFQHRLIAAPKIRGLNVF